MQPTFPDPYMTVVDACAEIARRNSAALITVYVETLPIEIRQDERVTRAVKARLDELRAAPRRKSA